MSTKLNAFCVLLAAVLAPTLLAQQHKVNVAPGDPVMIRRGQPVKQTLTAVVLPGFHVNSDKPRDEYLIPFKLTWDVGPLEAVSITYPKAEEMDQNGQKIVVFTGNVPIQTEFKPSKELPKGQLTVTGKLRYQACNDHMCFAPRTLDVKFTAVVE